MSMLGFQTLKCPSCSKSNVIPYGELVWQEGKGTALRHLGYFCFFCSKPFDNEGAIKMIKAQELRDKIKELEGQK